MTLLTLSTLCVFAATTGQSTQYAASGKFVFETYDWGVGLSCTACHYTGETITDVPRFKTYDPNFVPDFSLSIDCFIKYPMIQAEEAEWLTDYFRDQIYLQTATFPTYAYCGDGVVQEHLGEECDDGNMNPYDGCDNTCSVAAIMLPPEPAAKNDTVMYAMIPDWEFMNYVAANPEIDFGELAWEHTGAWVCVILSEQSWSAGLPVSPWPYGPNLWGY